MQRRSFLSGILAAAAAPAIVKADSLMPIWTPKWQRVGRVYIDGWFVGITDGLTIDRNEVFDEFVLVQSRTVLKGLGASIDELRIKHPVAQVQYISARESMFLHSFHTPLSRPLNVRSNHGQFPS